MFNTIDPNGNDSVVFIIATATVFIGVNIEKK